MVLLPSMVTPGCPRSLLPAAGPRAALFLGSVPVSHPRSITPMPTLVGNPMPSPSANPCGRQSVTALEGCWLRPACGHHCGGAWVLRGYLPRDLLTSQMWPLPQGTELMGDFLHCPSSSSESEVNSDVPTVLLSHLRMTLQSINGCGQRQLCSQAPKSHGEAWLGWPSPWGRGCGTLRLLRGWSLLRSNARDHSWHVLPPPQPHFSLCCKQNIPETKPPTPKHPSAPNGNRAAQRIK